MGNEAGGHGGAAPTPHVSHAGVTHIHSVQKILRARVLAHTALCSCERAAVRACT